MSNFIAPGDSREDRARVLILGEPGVGKTRLAATFPDPIFIDIEGDGSATALPESPARIIVPMSSTTLKDTVTALKSIQRGRKGPGLYEYEGEDLDHYISDRFAVYAPGGGFIFCTGHYVQPDIPPSRLIRAYSLVNELALKYGS